MNAIEVKWIGKNIKNSCCSDNLVLDKKSGNFDLFSRVIDVSSTGIIKCLQ